MIVRKEMRREMVVKKKEKEVKMRKEREVKMRKEKKVMKREKMNKTEFVCSFLAKHEMHYKKKEISEAKLSVIQLPWANPSNPAASGIFCMRHMEGYMGAQFKQWETELKAENSDAYQKRLRVIYLIKIVMSESNEVKEKIKKKMEEYKKGAGVLKALVVTGK